MGAALDDIGGSAELLGIDNAVVGLVGSGQHREIALRPVEVTGIDDYAAESDRMAVHVL